MLINTKSILITLSALLTVTNAWCYPTLTACDNACGEEHCRRNGNLYCC
ncbi:hypothetical protein Vi05172_g3069 [Venturia inaequalis]|nr:hypothetical protein Vi05172_g3069 [Venturia inaequalis]